MGATLHRFEPAGGGFVAYLGSLGAIPGWPGDQAWPPQPLLAQTRAVLNGYAVAGGLYREVVIEDAGHGPRLDQPERFLPSSRTTWPAPDRGRQPLGRPGYPVIRPPVR